MEKYLAVEIKEKDIRESEGNLEKILERKGLELCEIPYDLGNEPMFEPIALKVGGEKWMVLDMEGGGEDGFKFHRDVVDIETEVECSGIYTIRLGHVDE